MSAENSMSSVHAMRYVQLRFNPARSLASASCLMQGQPCVNKLRLDCHASIHVKAASLQIQELDRSSGYRNREPMFSLTGKIGTCTNADYSSSLSVASVLHLKGFT
jgi:hypothetical protein